MLPAKGPEEEEEDSDDDEEALAEQRAAFAAEFGMSLQSMVDSKADEEYFDAIDKYVHPIYLFSSLPLSSIVLSSLSFYVFSVPLLPTAQ